MENTKYSVLSLLEQLLIQRVIQPADIKKYLRDSLTSTDPEYIREEMEKWYRNAGIEAITGRKFNLSPCPFTEAEIIEAQQNQEIILCVPKGVKREELGKLFYIDSWVLHDSLVNRVTEKEDNWFRTGISMTPGNMKQTGMEVFHRFEEENKLNFSLERYLVFIGRVRYLTGQTPDSEYWIWLPQGRYDRSGMLIAGFDRNGAFNAHGWMPQFSAGFLGARFGIYPRKSGVNQFR
jgi:hypothetical protein